MTYFLKIKADIQSSSLGLSLLRCQSRYYDLFHTAASSRFHSLAKVGYQEKLIDDDKSQRYVYLLMLALIFEICSLNENIFLEGLQFYLVRCLYSEDLNASGTYMIFIFNPV